MTPFKTRLLKRLVSLRTPARSVTAKFVATLKMSEFGLAKQDQGQYSPKHLEKDCGRSNSTSVRSRHVLLPYHGGHGVHGARFCNARSGHGSENTSGILVKNIGLFSIACIMYILIGYDVMYAGGMLLTLTTLSKMFWHPEEMSTTPASRTSSSKWFSSRQRCRSFRVLLPSA